MSGRSAAEGGLLPLQVTLNCRRCLIWCVVFQRSFYVLSAGSGPGDRATPSASPSHDALLRTCPEHAPRV